MFGVGVGGSYSIGDLQSHATPYASEGSRTNILTHPMLLQMPAWGQNGNPIRSHAPPYASGGTPGLHHKISA